MTGYLINFSIYTLAMIGVIFLALYVFKTATNRGFSKKSGFLNIEESMNLSTRKTLYVIKAGEEKFLIASDIDKTSLISKLNDDKKTIREDKSIELKTTDGIDCIEDFASIINLKRNKSDSKEPVMRELARKLSAI